MTNSLEFLTNSQRTLLTKDTFPFSFAYFDFSPFPLWISTFRRLFQSLFCLLDFLLGFPSIFELDSKQSFRLKLFFLHFSHQLLQKNQKMLISFRISAGIPHGVSFSQQTISPSSKGTEVSCLDKERKQWSVYLEVLS